MINALEPLAADPKGPHYVRNAVACAVAILGGGGSRSFEPEAFEEQGQLGLGLSVAGRRQFVAAGDGDGNVEI